MASLSGIALSKMETIEWRREASPGGKPKEIVEVGEPAVGKEKERQAVDVLTASGDAARSKRARWHTEEVKAPGPCPV